MLITLDQIGRYLSRLLNNAGKLEHNYWILDQYINNAAQLDHESYP